jgi:hypothetical protein
MADDTGDVNEPCVGDCWDSIPGLYCTLCFLDLKSVEYLVCKHPDLPVPLCIDCMDVLRKMGEGEMRDICTWCRDGGTLFMCADDKCGRTICRSCMNNNMKGRAEKIEADDNWRCFHCRPRQLRHFKKALLIGQEQSLYSGVKNEGDEVEQLESRLVLLLDVIVGSIKEVRKDLSTDSVKFCEKKFRKELEGSER